MSIKEYQGIQCLILGTWRYLTLHRQKCQKGDDIILIQSFWMLVFVKSNKANDPLTICLL